MVELDRWTILLRPVSKSNMRLLAQGRVDAPQWVRDRLDLPDDSRAHMVRALREARGEPFMITDQYQPLDLARSLRRSDFVGPEARSRLVVQIVSERCGLTIGSVRQTMSAEKATKDTAPIAGLADRRPAARSRPRLPERTRPRHSNGKSSLSHRSPSLRNYGLAHGGGHQPQCLSVAAAAEGWTTERLSRADERCSVVELKSAMANSN